MEYHYEEGGRRVSLATWRYWEDMKLAIGRYLDWKHGPQRGRRAAAERASWEESAAEAQLELTEAYREVVFRHTRRQRIEPFELWRTLPDRGFLRVRKPTWSLTSKTRAGACSWRWASWPWMESRRTS
jgi:hypothetical protein